MDERSRDQEPRHEGSETGRSESEGAGTRGTRTKEPKKPGASRCAGSWPYVTLGAVAAITGLGGFLAVNPPSWALAPQTATQEPTSEAGTPAEPTPGEGAEQSEAGADPAPAGVEPAPVQEWVEVPQPAADQAPLVQEQAETPQPTVEQAPRCGPLRHGSPPLRRAGGREALRALLGGPRHGNGGRGSGSRPKIRKQGTRHFCAPSTTWPRPSPYSPGFSVTASFRG